MKVIQNRVVRTKLVIYICIPHLLLNNLFFILGSNLEVTDWGCVP